MLSDESIIDVNVTLGRWPTRRVPWDELPAMVAKLKSHAVAEAWVGSFDGLFHDDLREVNNRLAKACADESAMKLRPFGSIDPLATNWERELERCADTHKMRGIRLHPNYHRYRLDHPAFAQLLQMAAEQSLIVQLVVLMEDARMMHPLMRVPPVELGPLAKAAGQAPGLKLVLLNALTTANRTDKLLQLIDAGDVYVEIAMLEGVGGIESLLKTVPAERILFGSHAPSLYFESAALKLRESELPRQVAASIRKGTAERLLRVT
jgi:predicted TIM-barrel fold metal-dependent hydrolase